MNPQEASKITQLVVAATGQYTPPETAQLWVRALAGVDYREAEVAVQRLAARPVADPTQRQHWTPGVVVGEIHRIRDLVRNRPGNRPVIEPRVVRQVLMGTPPPPGERMRQVRALLSDSTRAIES